MVIPSFFFAEHDSISFTSSQIGTYAYIGNIAGFDTDPAIGYFIS
jgi:hypothetical protein